MTIYGCTILYNRLDLLEIWLNELKNSVDKFIILEGNKTHTGGKRDLIFNPDMFKDFDITYVPVTDIPEYSNEEFDRIEKYLNNYLLNSLKDCNNNDIILFTHGDEIPRRSSVIEGIFHLNMELKKNPYTEMIVRLRLMQQRYWLNCFLLQQKNFSDGGPFITTYRVVKEVGVWRIKHIYKGSPEGIMEMAGWHYSWLGPKEYVLDKLYVNVDQNYNKPEMFNYDYIQNVLDTGGDILQESRLLPGHKWIGTGFFNPNNKIVSNYLMPKYVLDNYNKFKHLIKIKENYEIG